MSRSDRRNAMRPLGHCRIDDRDSWYRKRRLVEHPLQLHSEAMTTNPVSGAPYSKYSLIAILLHWSTAALVLSTIPLGWYGATFETEAAQTATNIHKSIGIVILLMTSVRIGWRLSHKPPKLPIATTVALRWLASTTHLLFYVFLFVLPLSGWWMSSAVPTRHAFGFGFFSVPFLPVPRGFGSASPAHFVHINLAWIMVVLVVLHIAAALKHHLVDQDDLLARMLLGKS